MGKTIIKTAAVTFAAVIALIGAIYACLAIFAPKTVADIWASFGNYSVSVKYYEKQYNKTGDISDLAVLCVKLDENKDSARAADYLSALTLSDGFADFCVAEDENARYGESAHEYYFGKRAIAEYYANGISAAIAVADAAVISGYTEFNAFYKLLVGVKELSNGDVTAISAKISEIKGGLSGEQESFAERDIGIADSLLV